MVPGVKDVHVWRIDGIFRLFKGVDNDDGNIVGDRVFPGCQVIERRNAAEHSAAWREMGIIRNGAPRGDVV